MQRCCKFKKPYFCFVNNEHAIEHLVKEHGIRLTDIRKSVLEIFFNHQYALSHSDVEANLQSDFDRVTLYRTIKTFVTKGVLHKVIDGENAERYALCNHDHVAHKHLDNHVHFKCSTCGNTFCLDDVTVPDVQMPKGYTSNEVSMLIEGKCENC
ncbi:MAG: Fur family ferric uptake transcriptional regulator [Sphingobacteriales bacterium]|jgi:Fur family ferric uptake transcriptional regulator